MGTFFIGLGVGGVIGFVTMGLVAMRDPAESYDVLNRKREQIRRLATEQEAKSKDVPDAIGQAKAEGLWEAVKTLYED